MCTFFAKPRHESRSCSADRLEALGMLTGKAVLRQTCGASDFTGCPSFPLWLLLLLLLLNKDLRV